MPTKHIDEEGPSNAELKKLLEKALTRFQNWRVEVERDRTRASCTS
jgi:hypothetical protein